MSPPPTHPPQVRSGGTRVLTRGSTNAVVRLLARREGVTPLHVAAARGNHELCGSLVEWGADIAARDANGMIPLDFARARAGHSRRVPEAVAETLSPAWSPARSKVNLLGREPAKAASADDLRASAEATRRSGDPKPFNAIGRALGDAGALKRAGTAPSVPKRKKDKQRDKQKLDAGRDSLHSVAF